jgi:hypothetical protein
MIHSLQKWSISLFKKICWADFFICLIIYKYFLFLQLSVMVCHYTS